MPVAIATAWRVSCTVEGHAVNSLMRLRGQLGPAPVGLSSAVKKSKQWAYRLLAGAGVGGRGLQGTLVRQVHLAMRDRARAPSLE